MKSIRITVVAIVACLGLYLGYEAFNWTVNRVYVPEGYNLMLRYKGPLIFGSKNYAKVGHFAQEGEIGVLANLRGPGRHFYCPIWYERTIVPDVVIQPGQVGICTSKLGDNLDKGQFLVDGDLGDTKYKGILRKCFGPGRYRAHPYAYEFKTVQTQTEKVGLQVKHSGWVEIPAGYVGVVTYLTDDKTAKLVAGIQEKVLPPGLYPVNPREAQVDIVEIGYCETSITVDKKLGEGSTPERPVYFVDESGEHLPVEDTGISFPSNDGFKIHLDFTAIWGIMPEQAPQIVRTFGNVEAVEQKVIIPQSESICRNNGSKLGAVDLLVGESRQQFQTDTSSQFKSVLEGGEVPQEDGTTLMEGGKNVTLLYGLVRHIYIPQEVRIPIQEGYIADELKLTRSQEKDTAKVEANLREAEQMVVFGCC